MQLRKVVLFFLCAAALLTFASAVSAKEYTKEQLIRMVNSGNFPEQGPPETLADKAMSFAACVESVRAISSSLGGYPYNVVLNTVDVYMVKMWANDAALVATCSRPDGKMVMTRSAYR